MDEFKEVFGDTPKDSGKGTDRVCTDGMDVSRDEAVELVIHHLRMAALFFEATPDDATVQLRGELLRMHPNAPWYEAGCQFIRQIEATYRAMDDE